MLVPNNLWVGLSIPTGYLKVPMGDQFLFKVPRELTQGSRIMRSFRGKKKVQELMEMRGCGYKSLNLSA